MPGACGSIRCGVKAVLSYCTLHYWGPKVSTTRQRSLLWFAQFARSRSCEHGSDSRRAPLEKAETVRWMNLGLYWGAQTRGITAVAMAASANPILAEKAVRVPTLFCTALKRQRFYMFMLSEPGYAPSPTPYPFSVVDPSLQCLEIRRSRYLQRAPEVRRAIDRRARQRSHRPRQSTRRWATCTCGCSRSKLTRLWRTSSGTHRAGTMTGSSSTT